MNNEDEDEMSAQLRQLHAKSKQLDEYLSQKRMEMKGGSNLFKEYDAEKREELIKKKRAFEKILQHLQTIEDNDMNIMNDIKEIEDEIEKIKDELLLYNT
jgi:predicted  nucleic acid-binding Zn-ribbon protein